MYPKAFSHIGIFVSDLDKAVEFYSRVLGLYVLMPPTTVLEDDSAIGVMCQDVFGSGFGKFRIAHLSTVDKVGIELFEFEGCVPAEPVVETRRGGLFHFAIQDPDIQGLADRIVAAGGRQLMPVRQYYPGEKPYSMVYCADPFGNLLEIYTHSYELTYSAGAYQDPNPG